MVRTKITGYKMLTMERRAEIIPHCGGPTSKLSEPSSSMAMVDHHGEEPAAEAMGIKAASSVADGLFTMLHAEEQFH